jgi:anti-sigma B factor antagonist
MTATSMNIATRQSGDVLVVDLAGRLDSSTAGSAYDQLTGLAKGGAKKILLNLDNLQYISSAGLRAILTTAKLVQTARGEIRLCKAQPVVKEALETSGFNSLIRLLDDEQSAIASFS